MEAMTHGMPEDDGAHVPEGAERCSSCASGRARSSWGPGIGRTEGALEWAREVARRAPVPLLIDADGLNAHAERLESLRERPAPTVLTPHEGELGPAARHRVGARCRPRGSRARARPPSAAAAIVVLKGDDTIVAAPGRARSRSAPAPRPRLRPPAPATCCRA